MPLFKGRLKMEFADILKSLCSVSSISGNESTIVSTVKELCPKNAEIICDNIGNIKITLSPKNAKHKILLDAHCDQLGFVVTGFCQNGFIKVAPVGSIDVRTLYGCRVEVLAKQRLDGVFSTVPPHLQKDGDSKKFPAVEDIAIDVGLSKNEVCSLAKIGDFVAIKNEFLFLNQNRVCSSGIDNKVSVAILLYVLRRISQFPLKNTSVTLLLSVQEELGMRGAQAAEFSADCVISLDASFADYPGAPKDKTAKLGSGPMLGISPVLSASLMRSIESAAQNKNIPFQYEVMSGSTGTNADKLSLCADIPCALISIPILNMHSAVEITDLRDGCCCADLIDGFLREVDAK